MTPSAHVVASWQRDAVHVWGWDGVQTMPPWWLVGGFPPSGRLGPPSDYGFHSSLDVVTTSGVRLRPASVRLDAIAGLDWLRAEDPASDSVRWFGAIAELAERVVEAGRLHARFNTPSEPSPHEVPGLVAEMRWTPTTTPPPRRISTTCRSDAADLRPRRAVDDDRGRADSSARSTPGSSTPPRAPSCTRPAGSPYPARPTRPAVIRLMFRALTGQDHRVRLTGSPTSMPSARWTSIVRRLAQRVAASRH